VGDAPQGGEEGVATALLDETTAGVAEHDGGIGVEAPVTTLRV